MRAKHAPFAFALVAGCVNATPATPAPANVAVLPAPIAPPVPSSAPPPVEMAPMTELPPPSAPPQAPPPPPPPTAPPPAASAPPPKPAPKPAATNLADKDPLLTSLFASGGATLKMVSSTPEKYRFQVLYGVIKGGAIERHGFRADVEYFFPASSMKVPITLASYDRLAMLRTGGGGAPRPAFTREASMRIHPANGSGEPYTTTLARETWRALIVSDNFSANRLLAFVGHREAHETLWSVGLSSARIHSGFATGGEIDPAEVSPKIDVSAGAATDELPARKSTLALPPTDAKGLAIGVANIVDGRRVEGPLSFADKNAMRLVQLQDTLVRIMRPELLPPGSKADAASKDDLAYVRQALGTLPSESGLAGYDRNIVADYTLSPFLRGIERVRPRGKFQIFSKVGQAFGFLIHNAYVVDKETNRAFFLIAAIYANPDDVLNDDSYAYDSISFPALADVGEVVTRHAFAAP